MTPLLLGHRGTPHLHPENTLDGFRAALHAGLDGVELDVRRLGDGTLVIHHDPHLLDGRDLQTLGARTLPAHVPTLDAALAWAASSGAFVNVEVKVDGDLPDDRTVRTLDAIRAYGLTGQVIVSSFSPRALALARAHAPDIERGFLMHRRYRLGAHDLVPAVMRRLDARAVHPHYSLVDAPLMALAAAHGWHVNVWTVNDAAEVQRLRALGVHALIGDHPDVLQCGASTPTHERLTNA
ncbi:glycerophosphodiester phosphodiesterase [Deinococcus maricopensis]|uniref:Glycerophosphoryl diester phosphodiesterase n=1 Tax=Deinococcus maricopensis (strain DSM 21211 / LMG 22137 / NRRL B-23946 / LB-34) TaxID=709986 RepID=E8U302_DEIML|nr:glycerophosphodiester phosphodiesterase [Deinococcus maricopensis]ADV65740.1 glycerophosphoryl diester phosphodiesterase [Deinococcus maricopensis DSM 21211]